MKPAKTLFEGLGYQSPDVVSLNVGAPGPATLKRCADLMIKATQARLKDEIQANAELMQYGSPQGDPSFIAELARFLSAGYGDPVEEISLVTTAGATNGLHVMLTVLFPQRAPVFVEELTYHLALSMLEGDFKFPVIPVNMDIDGLNIEDFRLKIVQAKQKYGDAFKVPEHGYWSVLYSIPTFHNPTGRCLSAEKAKQLLDLAHEHRILIITEDVYNLLYYEGNAAPKRLFAYDRDRASANGDKNGGCVISNGTFSKLLTPGLRLGWLELPLWIRQMWDKCGTLYSGGSLNMYTSGVVAKAMEMGLVSEFVQSLRVEYKKRRDVIMEKFNRGLPPGCRVEVPKGGYFIWIELPRHVKAKDVHQIMKEKHRILIHEGTKFCLPDHASKFDNCIRIAISYAELDPLANAAEKLAQVITECSKSNH